MSVFLVQRLILALKLLFGEIVIRISLNSEEGLFEPARALTGLKTVVGVVREHLKALIARASARRLAFLDGSAPLPRSVVCLSIYSENR